MLSLIHISEPTRQAEISYASFEALTLGTLAFIIVMALIGYWRGAPLRRAGISTES